MATGLVRLKTRADFLRVAARRGRVARRGFVLQMAPAPSGSGSLVRVGFTASRKVGNAVVRNRAKRRLRAAADKVLRERGRPGSDYVLIAREGGTVSQIYAELLNDLGGALRQIERPASEPRVRRPEEG